MNLQEQLSLNAKDPEAVALQARSEKERLAQETAQQLGKEITEDIQRHLVICVQQGEYERHYNKGTVRYHYIIPKNKYLKLRSASQYNRKHIQTDLSYQFLVEEEYALEFEHLNTYLQKWGKENHVEITWIIREQGRTFGYSFPSTEQISFSPRTWFVFELTIQAVSNFPIDPNLPMDYLTAEEAREQAQKERERIKRMEDLRNKQKQEVITLGILTAVFVVGLLICLYMCISLPGINMWLPILMCIGMIIFFGSLTHSYHDSYVQSKETVENALKRIQGKDN